MPQLTLASRITLIGLFSLALAVGMGMVLALTRERPEEGGGTYGR